jgi:hypothetical protein
MKSSGVKYMSAIFYIQPLCTRIAGTRHNKRLPKRSRRLMRSAKQDFQTLNSHTKRNTGKQLSGRIQASAFGRVWLSLHVPEGLSLSVFNRHWTYNI